MRKVIIALPILAVFLLALVFSIALSSTDGLAQDNPTPIVIPPLEGQAASVLEPFMGNYQVVFLQNAAEGNTRQSKLDSLVNLAQARTAHNVDDLARLDAENPIEAVVVDESAYASIDAVGREWFISAVERGVVVAGINLRRDDFQALRGRECKLDSSVVDPIETSGQEFFLIASIIVFAENASDQELIEEVLKTQCISGPPSINTAANYHLNRGSSRGFLSTDADLENFINELTSHILSVRSAKQKFANRHLLPTAMPQLP